MMPFKTLKEWKSKYPGLKILKVKRKRYGSKRKTEAVFFIECPNGKGPKCKKARWTTQATLRGQEINKRGFCSSCSRFRGARQHPSGYVFVYDGRRQRPEHRLVMEKKIGRKLRRDEDVHHRNLIRSDNRPSNLEIKWVHHGRGAILSDLIAYLRQTGWLVKKEQ